VNQSTTKRALGILEHLAGRPDGIPQAEHFALREAVLALLQREAVVGQPATGGVDDGGAGGGTAGQRPAGAALPHLQPEMRG
jgi:hypothetical protein